MDVVALAPRIPVPGETISGNGYFTNPGGKGANQAFAAARLGGEVAMLGCVGNDDFGRAMRQNLVSVGCCVKGIRTVDGPSGVAVIIVAASGQNSIVVVPGANHRYLGDDVDGHMAEQETGGVALLQLEIPLASVLAAARKARESKRLVILDPAPAPASPLPAELFGLVDILTPNETEATTLAGLPPSAVTRVEAAALARKLLAMVPKTVIMKLGEQGCLIAEQSGIKAIEAPRVQALDTTAAGDVFNAALAVGLSNGMALESACRFAVQASALSVTRLGAQPSAPSRAEVMQFAAGLGLPALPTTSP